MMNIYQKINLRNCLKIMSMVCLVFFFAGTLYISNDNVKGFKSFSEVLVFSRGFVNDWVSSSAVAEFSPFLLCLLTLGCVFKGGLLGSVVCCAGVVSSWFVFDILLNFYPSLESYQNYFYFLATLLAPLWFLLWCDFIETITKQEGHSND